MDFNEIRHLVPTTDWKIKLGVCWANTFDFYGKKMDFNKFHKTFCIT